jgi:hypothetical protein
LGTLTVIHHTHIVRLAIRFLIAAVLQIEGVAKLVHDDTGKRRRLTDKEIVASALSCASHSA